MPMSRWLLQRLQMNRPEPGDSWRRKRASETCRKSDPVLQLPGEIQLHLIHLSISLSEILICAELRIQEGRDYFPGQPGSNDLGAQAENAYVIVLNTLMGAVNVVADTRPDSRSLVCADGCSETGSAEHYCSIRLALPNRITNPAGQIGKIHPLRRVVSVIDDVDSQIAQDPEDLLSHGITGVIIGKGDCHIKLGYGAALHSYGARTSFTNSSVKRSLYASGIHGMPYIVLSCSFNTARGAWTSVLAKEMPVLSPISFCTSASVR